jgi:outer membrane protein OmpA-like peptidoglycan-associated protein
MKTSHPLLAAAVSAALLLSACATAPYQASRDPYDDRPVDDGYPDDRYDDRYDDRNGPPPGEDVNRTRRGAITGAVAGAVIGLLSGDDATERRQHALIGAAGGAVGRYQDNQEAALRERMADTGVDVVRQGDNITLDIPSGITFNFDSAEILPGFRGTLDRLAQVLGEYDQSIIEVAGHTDNVGTDAYNQALSVRRAQAVGDYLVARGINRERLIIVGAGETRPVASNETDAGRAENRRVELTVVPLREN